MFKRKRKDNGIVIPNVNVADATQIAYFNAPRAMSNCGAHYVVGARHNRDYIVLWGDEPGIWIEAENFEAVRKFIHRNYVTVQLVKADTVRRDFHPLLKGTTIYAGYFLTSINGGLQVQVTVCDVTDGFWPSAYDIPNSVALSRMANGYTDYALS